MRIPSHTTEACVGFNMTPMIDVVFQLIIFFLLSSHLARQETRYELPLPAAESGRAEQPDERARLTINVLADGTAMFTGRAMPADELSRQLAERRSVHGDDLEVRIRSDRSVEYARIEPILLACARAGIWNVSFAVLQRSDVDGGLRGENL
jgi:biopolymer transport protein ExbD